MKLRSVVVDRVRVEHRLFRSNRKRQSQETGCYTVTISLEKKTFPMVATLHMSIRQRDFWKRFILT